MAVAADVQKSPAAEVEACFGIAFGIKLYKLTAIPRYIGNKGDEMLLFHRMMYGDKMFVLHRFNGYCMFSVTFFGFQRRQSYSAAAYKAFARGVNYISADWTHIEF